MKAGRELDKMIAEKVLGIKVLQDCEMTRDRKWQQDEKNYPWILEREEYLCFFLEPNNIGVYWNPSTDIKDAWLVVEELDYDVKVTKYNALEPKYQAHVFIPDNVKMVFAETAPMAICLAALEAVGYEITNK